MDQELKQLCVVAIAFDDQIAKLEAEYAALNKRLSELVTELTKVRTARSAARGDCMAAIAASS